MKACTKCGEFKPLDGFHKDAQKRDGKCSACKVCGNAASLKRSQKNPVAHSASARRWASKNPLARKAIYDRWASKNMTLVLAKNAAYRARKRKAKGSYSAADVESLFVHQRGKCPVCRDALRKGFHVDHVTPLARGGSNDRLNLQLLCPPCNRSKNARDPILFMQQRGYLL